MKNCFSGIIVCRNIETVFQELLKGDNHRVFDITEECFIFHILCKNVAWVDYAKNVFDLNIFRLMAFSSHISWRFRWLIPFEVTEAANWTAALLLLYILVQEYASVIKISLTRCFSDWLLCSNISRCWAPWECRGLQAWAPRVHHSYLWEYFWPQIPSVGYSEVQGGYGVYQEILCVWHVCHITRGSHNLWVPCTRGYSRIPKSCGYKAVGTGYQQIKVSIPTLTCKGIQCDH